MTEPTQTSRAPRKRPGAASVPHHDMVELISAMKRLAECLEPLAEHVPVLVEVAKTWNAAAATGKNIGRGARWISAFGKWLGGVALAVAIILALIHQKWDALLGALK